MNLFHSSEFQIGDNVKLLPHGGDFADISKEYFEQNYPNAIGKVGKIQTVTGKMLEVKFEQYKELIKVSTDEVELMEGF